MDCFRVGQICGIGCFHEPGKISLRVQAIFYGRLDQAEHDSTAGSSLGRVGKQEVLPVNDKRLNASLGPPCAMSDS